MTEGWFCKTLDYIQLHFFFVQHLEFSLSLLSAGKYLALWLLNALPCLPTAVNKSNAMRAMRVNQNSVIVGHATEQWTETHCKAEGSHPFKLCSHLNYIVAYIRSFTFVTTFELQQWQRYDMGTARIVTSSSLSVWCQCRLLWLWLR